MRGKNFIGTAVKTLTFGGLLFGIAACTIFPTAGPSKSQLLAGSSKRGGETLLVQVTQRVADITNVDETLRFPSTFLQSGGMNTDVVRSGDVLVLTVYENVEAGILGSAGLPSVINHIQVDQTGHIFVPYAGRIPASGKTTEELRRSIEASLAAQTPDPQVQLARAEGTGASVTVLGTMGQGVYQIDNSTRHLTGILAQASRGSSIATGQEDLTKVTLQRGSQTGSVWLQDLYTNPRNDVHVRPNDRIIISQDVRSYTVMGQVGNTGLRSFSKPKINALEAIAQSRGVNSYSGDSTGIFVLRDEKPEIVSQLTGVSNFVQSRRVLYVLNIVQPDGLFLAQDFEIRDNDIMFVTEAPYSQFTKVISTFLGVLGTGDRLVNTIEDL
ncbi:sugar ABC transporter substrate-binding protein [Amylibacter marinus]|uniref:Sugar ABC transporter substrate-binding protein n=1 Tax=Amylibacter marinus TaxID=1475483 RepID=A0ABQ5VTS0_9RHOB|nr:polysaccharide biosynthesis/export family protein [Amylibacter marinus]GLQ34675.1 sugar ABC transporter substrate-binding protein [Amylibacter marinus]